jgi:hypothetical protein
MIRGLPASYGTPEVPMTLAGLAILLLAAAPTPPASTADEEAVVRALKEYHAGFAANEPDRVLAVLGPTYFIGDETSGGGKDRVRAHFFKTGEALRAWPRGFLDGFGPYADSTAVLSVSVRGDSAVVIAKETGRNRVRSWRDEETTWLFGRTDGRWRIVGQIIRDIQLPRD